MTKPLKIGLIGCGGIMRGAHLNPGWLKVPDVELVAACDVHEAGAKKLAADFDIPKVFTDFNDLLKIKEIDLVDICTPNKVHTPSVIAALGAGKHVICEKPLAVSVEEVLAIREAERKSGKLLMTAQHHRFSEASVAIKAWCDTGALGEVYHARVNATRRNHLPTAPGFIDPKLSGGGPCMDIGVHALDTALWLMNFPRPVRVSGRAHTEELIALAEAIRNGKPSPVPVDQSLIVIAILEAIMKSSQLNEEVTIPDFSKITSAI